MTNGSIAIPGAIIFVNDDISTSSLSRLVSQLQINETVTLSVFSSRLTNDPSYTINIRAQRRRLLVKIDLTNTENRMEADVIISVKNGLASIVSCCFGPPGATYKVLNLTWGQLGIHSIDLTRTCSACQVWCGQCRCSSSCRDPMTNVDCCDMTYSTHFGRNCSSCCAQFPYGSSSTRDCQYTYNYHPQGANYTYQCPVNETPTPIDCPLVRRCCS